ncbi:MAG: DUF4147 domain-containing protein [Planctomycetaceae bacterium]|nr:DUF4147 domain-containing protein [Planctomycetaceae bacterium]
MSLRQDAIRIWQAGVDAVRAEELVRRSVQVIGDRLRIAGDDYSLSSAGRLLVVGAGKAGAGMATGLEQALGNWPGLHRRSGWVNVPANCLRPTGWIHLHAARPAGFNAPTKAAVEGTARILGAVSDLGTDDLCIVLISGGGSALLTAPVEGVSLEDKQAVTRLLSEGGATIEELNCVRRALSRVKGGGLLQACHAGTVAALVISDVIGDPLETIASGPLTPNPTTVDDAARILEQFARDRSAVPDAVWNALDTSLDDEEAGRAVSRSDRSVQHYVIGNNRSACEAAAIAARTLGYEVLDVRPDERGVAREVGRELAIECHRLQGTLDAGRRCCLITGGEPVVQLSPTDRPRKGGRNQELTLAALVELQRYGLEGIAVLSGGTDGEDGPTDAAGAVADQDVAQRATDAQLDPISYLDGNDSYPFFEATGGLIRTGPTHTNVMDLRIAVMEGQAATRDQR